MSAQTLEQLLDSLTAEGELYEKLPDGAVRCYACGHRCLIREGRRGICKVRFNAGGVLRVPWGYVGAVQCDPTEKKPFFHILPGSDTLTFGMLGCDFHCPYCLAPGVRIATDQGPVRIEALFDEGQTLQTHRGEEIRQPARETLVCTHSGEFRPVVRLFRHRYRGQMLRVKAAYLPPVDCTPEHEFLVSDVVPGPSTGARHFQRAGQLRRGQWLAIPKVAASSRSTAVDTTVWLTPQLKPRHHVSYVLRAAVDTTVWLTPQLKPYRTRRTIGRDMLEEVMALSESGMSSSEIGMRIGKEASHVRHLKSKLGRGIWAMERLGIVDRPLVVEGDRVRLPKEHQPGIPLALPLDTRLARLLGYYCAEGCVVHSKGRVHSAVLSFSFGCHEEPLADEVVGLVQDVFGLRANKVRRPTTLGVSVEKASLALCIESLCGRGARNKRVPPMLFDAPKEVVEAFLRAYAAGDGHTRANGMTQITTVSEDLAYGVAWLALQLGMFPAISKNGTGDRLVMGRRVNASAYQYSVNWYFERVPRKHLHEDEHYWYVPIVSVDTYDYDGDVYNLEVEGEHSYLANLVPTHNCQNWVTSQALRDSASEQAGAYPRLVTPRDLVTYGKRLGASLVGSSYNEPLITSEWAAAVFREAVGAGMKCVYISNGNATRETLEYIRPFVVGYKIDLKTMNDRNYRQLGGVLQNVLDSIRLVHDMGFWEEIVTLVIPGFNDDPAELRAAAEYIASVSPDIPWHVTAFHKDYKMTDPDDTTPSHLRRALEIGREAGLRFVYAGNLPGQVGDAENTRCPNCRALLVERLGYVILDYRLTDDGKCPECAAVIPGIWPASRGEVRLGSAADLYFRRPRPISRLRSDLAEWN